MRENPDIIEKYNQEEKIWKRTNLNFVRDMMDPLTRKIEPESLEEALILTSEDQNSADLPNETDTIPVYRCNVAYLTTKMVSFSSFFSIVAFHPDK